MMKMYKLQGFVPKRRGGFLFWLGLLVLAAAAVDRFYYPFLGPAAIGVWAAGGLFIVLAILLRFLSAPQTASLQVGEAGILIDYAGYQLPIAYEDMGMITGGRISQHHSLKEFGRQERQAVQPFFNQTQIFIALRKEIEGWQEAKQHMPKFMFGTTQIGVLLVVGGEDWLAVERTIDAARVAWMGKLKSTYQEEYLTPAARLWADADDDDDDDA